MNSPKTQQLAMDFDLLHPEQVLVITAHPDDPEFMAGGSIARWTGTQAQVSYVIVTDGGKGSNNPDADPAELIRIREAEQIAAASLLGVDRVIFLNHPDGGVFNTPSLRADLVRQIRMQRPKMVVTHDPTAFFIGDNWINHPDHLAVGETALNAVFPLARDHLNFPEHAREGLLPHTVQHVLLVNPNESNFVMDISATIDVKIAAILAHLSQISDPHATTERILERARAAASGMSFEFGERFRYIALRR